MKEYNITIRCEADELHHVLLDMHSAMEAVGSWISNPRGLDHECDKWMWTLDLEPDNE
jgi:hypothetical protein